MFTLLTWLHLSWGSVYTWAMKYCQEFEATLIYPCSHFSLTESGEGARTRWCFSSTGVWRKISQATLNWRSLLLISSGKRSEWHSWCRLAGLSDWHRHTRFPVWESANPAFWSSSFQNTCTISIILISVASALSSSAWKQRYSRSIWLFLTFLCIVSLFEMLKTILIKWRAHNIVSILLLHCEAQVYQ